MSPADEVPGPVIPRRRRWPRPRIPVVRQLIQAECGAACLAMVLRYHGRHVPLAQLRSELGIDRDGTDARAIVEVAEAHGLAAHGVEVDAQRLGELPEASILYLGSAHFVVFERLRRQGVQVLDPALGRRLIPWADFTERFGRVALVFAPGPAFTRRTPPPTQLWKQLKPYLADGRMWLCVLALSGLLQLLTLALPVTIGVVVERVIPDGGDLGLLRMVALALALMGITQFLATSVRANLLAYFSARIDLGMGTRFFRHLVSLPYAFFEGRQVGDLVQRLSSNVAIRELVTGGAVAGALGGVFVLGNLVLLCAASPSFGLLTLALALVQVVVFMAAASRYRLIVSGYLDRQAAQASYQTNLLEGIESLKALGAEERAVQKWSRLFQDSQSLGLMRERSRATFDAVQTLLQFAAPSVVLLWSAGAVARGEMGLAAMLTLNALATSCFGPIAQVTSLLYLDWPELQGYADRLEDVLATPTEASDGGTLPAPRLTGRVRLEGVRFQYGRFRRPAVDGVDLQIQSGQCLAIVGPSGAGKSTLGSLILGLRRPVAGRVLFDGQDLATLDARSIRRQVGVVTQQPFLFGGTIRENISCDDDSMSLSAVMAAARQAHIHDFISSLPMGYQTRVGGAGVSLSGGQRQRIALARAFARRPALLLLDEATNGLDVLTEAEIQTVLEQLRSTRIVIAHRLSTIARADAIVVMDGGRVVESGTHHSLLSAGGLYARLVAAQDFAAPDTQAVL